MHFGHGKRGLLRSLVISFLLDLLTVLTVLEIFLIMESANKLVVVHWPLHLY